MVDPNLPQDQIDSLALRTQAAAAIGEVIVVGETITKYWSPAVLGMAANFTAFGADSAILSVALDVTGCTRFRLGMLRTLLAAGGDISNSFQIMLLMSVNGQMQALGNNGSQLRGPVQKLGAVVPATGVLGGVFPRTDAFSAGWSSNVTPNTGWGGAAATIGRVMQIAVVTVAAPNANQSYAFELWGAQ